jgi:hypothetical protein
MEREIYPHDHILDEYRRKRRRTLFGPSKVVYQLRYVKYKELDLPWKKFFYLPRSCNHIVEPVPVALPTFILSDAEEISIVQKEWRRKNTNGA